MFLVVPLKGIFGFENIVAAIEIAFKNRGLFCSIRVGALLSRASGLRVVSIAVCFSLGDSVVLPCRGVWLLVGGAILVGPQSRGLSLSCTEGRF